MECKGGLGVSIEDYTWPLLTPSRAPGALFYQLSLRRQRVETITLICPPPKKSPRISSFAFCMVSGGTLSGFGAYKTASHVYRVVQPYIAYSKGLWNLCAELQDIQKLLPQVKETLLSLQQHMVSVSNTFQDNHTHGTISAEHAAIAQHAKFADKAFIAAGALHSDASGGSAIASHAGMSVASDYAAIALGFDCTAWINGLNEMQALTHRYGDEAAKYAAQFANLASEYRATLHNSCKVLPVLLATTCGFFLALGLANILQWRQKRNQSGLQVDNVVKLCTQSFDNEHVKRELKHCQQREDALKVAHYRLTSKLDKLSQKIQKTSKELHQHKKDLQQKARDLKSSQRDCKSFKDLAEQRKDILASKLDQLQKSEIRISTVQTELSNLKVQSAQFHGEMSKKQMEVADLTAQLSHAQEIYNGLSSELHQSNTLNDTLGAQNAEKHRELTHVEEARRSVEAKLAEKELQATDLETRTKEVEERLENAVLQLQEMKKGMQQQADDHEVETRNLKQKASLAILYQCAISKAEQNQTHALNQMRSAEGRRERAEACAELAADRLKMVEMATKQQEEATAKLLSDANVVAVRLSSDLAAAKQQEKANANSLAQARGEVARLQSQKEATDKLLKEAEKRSQSGVRRQGLYVPLFLSGGLIGGGLIGLLEDMYFRQSMCFRCSLLRGFGTSVIFWIITQVQTKTEEMQIEETQKVLKAVTGGCCRIVKSIFEFLVVCAILGGGLLAFGTFVAAILEDFSRFHGGLHGGCPR